MSISLAAVTSSGSDPTVIGTQFATLPPFGFVDVHKLFALASSRFSVEAVAPPYEFV
jgi:hypothetical protein